MKDMEAGGGTGSDTTEPEAQDTHRRVDPFAANRAFEREILLRPGSRRQREPYPELEGGTLICRIVYDEEAETVIYERPGDLTPEI